MPAPAPPALRFAVLGPLEITVDAEHIPLGGPKQRLVLARGAESPRPRRSPNGFGARDRVRSCARGYGCCDLSPGHPPRRPSRAGLPVPHGPPGPPGRIARRLLSVAGRRVASRAQRAPPRPGDPGVGPRGLVALPGRARGGDPGPPAGYRAGAATRSKAGKATAHAARDAAERAKIIELPRRVSSDGPA